MLGCVAMSTSRHVRLGKTPDDATWTWLLTTVTVPVSFPEQPILRATRPIDCEMTTVDAMHPIHEPFWQHFDSPLKNRFPLHDQRCYPP